MRYNIIDSEGNIVDRNLTYDEALIWVDSDDYNPLLKKFSIVPSKESGDQNNSCSLWFFPRC